MQLTKIFIEYISIGSLAVAMSICGTVQDRDFVDPDPNAELSNKTHREEQEERRLLDNLVSRMIAAQELMRNHSSASEFLEFTESQNTELEQLREQYAGVLGDEFPDLPNIGDFDFDKIQSSKEYQRLSDAQRTRVMEIRHEMMVEMTKILVREQLERLSNMDKRVGLPKLLVSSPIGDMIELSDSQKRRITSEASVLSEDIEKFSNKVKERSRSIIKDNINDSQWVRLQEVLGDEYLDSYPRVYPIEAIGMQYAFESEK